MSVGASLKAALADSYHYSWRLVVLNGALSLAILAVLLAASYAQPALALLILIGPLAAALMHCAVRLAETAQLSLRDALTGLRLNWRRGIELAAFTAVVITLGILAVVFYAGLGTLTWPLAVAVGYLLALFGVLQLALWPLAVAEPDRAFPSVLADAAVTVARRPLASVVLAFALLLVNALGAVTILPLLTLTIAYSFIAAAHFTLPRNPLREA